MSYIKVLTLTAQFSCILPILIGLLRFRNLENTGKVFFYFMIYCGFTEWFAYYLDEKYHNNIPYLYVFTLVEYWIFCYVLIPQLTLFKKWHKQMLLILLLTMVGLLVVDMVVHSIYRFNTISRTTEAVIIVLMGLAYLLEYFQADYNTKLSGNSVFWIAAGAITYFGISFLYNMFNIFSISDVKLNKIIQTAHLLASITAYILFAVGFWISKPQNADPETRF
jgi:hypothetical protein